MDENFWLDERNHWAIQYGRILWNFVCKNIHDKGQLNLTGLRLILDNKVY